MLGERNCASLPHRRHFAPPLCHSYGCRKLDSSRPAPRRHRRLAWCAIAFPGSGNQIADHCAGGWHVIKQAVKGIAQFMDFTSLLLLISLTSFHHHLLRAGSLQRLQRGFTSPMLLYLRYFADCPWHQRYNYEPGHQEMRRDVLV